MKSINRLPALVVALILGCASAAALLAAPDPRARPGDRPGTATAATPGRRPSAEARHCRASPGATPSKEVIANPYGLEALWKQGDFVSRGHAHHPGDHVDGQLVHHVREGVRAGEGLQAGA